MAADCWAWSLLCASRGGGGVRDRPRWRASVRRSAAASRSGLRLVLRLVSALTAELWTQSSPGGGGDVRPRLRLRSRRRAAAGEGSLSLLAGVLLRSETAVSRLTGSLQTVSCHGVVADTGDRHD